MFCQHHSIKYNIANDFQMEANTLNYRYNMKKILFIILISIPFCNANYAQLTYGLNAGIQSGYYLDKYFYIDSYEKGKELLLKVEKGKYGLHFGVFTRLQMGPLFLQPQAQFNSDNIAYTLRDLNDSQAPKRLFRERFYSVTLPLKIGLKRSIFTFHSGPVANYQLISISDLWNQKGFSKQINKLAWSWTLGMGIDLWIARLDFSIEQGLGRYGDHIQIQGSPFNFSKNPGRFVTSMYIAL